DRFREILNGDRKGFMIEFQDGSKFVGQWKAVDPKERTCAGSYKISLTLENGKKKSGMFQFKPTPETPTVRSFLDKEAKTQAGCGIKQIHSLTRDRGGATGKKWVGVY
ncbi:MAG: hypothetical protein Q8N81_04490, partial [bacterium]|nr:hypothetical protein [bacterium]